MTHEFTELINYSDIVMDMEVENEVTVPAAGVFWGTSADEASRSSMGNYSLQEQAGSGESTPSRFFDLDSNGPQEIISSDTVVFELLGHLEDSNYSEFYQVNTQPQPLAPILPEVQNLFFVSSQNLEQIGQPPLPEAPQASDSLDFETIFYDLDERGDSSPSLDSVNTNSPPSTLNYEFEDELQSQTSSPIPNVVGTGSRRRRRPQATAQKRTADSKCNSQGAFYPWYQRNRFRRRMKTLFEKFDNLECRTGAKANITATYLNQTFTMSELEDLVSQKTTGQGQGQVDVEGQSSRDRELDVDPTSEELEGDHPYAATILTQKKSSTSVHDHQYNDEGRYGHGKRFKRAKQEQVAQRSSSRFGDTEEDDSSNSSNSKGPSSTSTTSTEFMQVKCRRERTLVQLLDTIYKKVKELKDMFEACFEVTVTYETHQLTSENYKDVRKIVGPAPVRAAPVPVAIVSNAVVTRVAASSTTTVRFPARSRLAGNIGNRTNRNRNQKSPEIVEISESKSNSSCDFQEDADEIEIGGQRSPSPTLGNEDDPDPASPSPTSASACPSPPTATAATTQKPDVKFSTTTSDTEAICQKCQKFMPRNHDPSREIFWIPCAAAFCKIVVHPRCIGIQVKNRQELFQTPRFYCERHWKQIEECSP